MVLVRNAKVQKSELNAKKIFGCILVGPSNLKKMRWGDMRKEFGEVA